MVSTDNRKAAVKKLRLLAYNSKVNVNVFRKKIEDAFSVSILPNHVERSEHTYGGVNCDVLSPEMYSSKRVLFYVHGGSFTGGSRASYRSFCSVLANKTFSRVVVPEYRLAPTYTFPAAIEDVQAVFRALFTEEQIARSLDSTVNEFGEKQEVMPEIIVAADGAGATIALALLLNLRERYRKCIKKVILLSPWLNVSPNSPLFAKKKAADEILSKENIQQSALSYTYEANLENPLVSPLLAAPEMYDGFPEVYIQCGSEEILLEDAQKFDAMLKKYGVQCTLDTFNGMMHLFQLADDYVSTAHTALDSIAKAVSVTEAENGRCCFENKPRLEHGIRSEA